MEPIHTCEAHSKEEPEQLFATIKQLPLDKFKKLYIVDGVQGHYKLLEIQYLKGRLDELYKWIYPIIIHE